MSKAFDRLDEDQEFTRRTFIISGIQGLLGLGVLSRLFYLGIFKKEEFKSLADDNRIKVHFLLPKRGLIFDRTGKVIADTSQSFRLMLTPYECPDIPQTLQYLKTFLPLGDEDIDSILDNIKSKPRYIATTVCSDIAWKDVCRINVEQLSLKGCSVENSWMRSYPYGADLVHTLGYVQIPSLHDKQSSPLFRLADFRVGKAGLEKKFDASLRGQAGYRETEVNARNRAIRHLNEIPSHAGQSLQLTLNLDLQRYVAERLQEHKSGAAVVMDVLTGHILALHSHPGFDPHVFVKGIKKGEWQELLNDLRRPLHNKALKGLYPPGSIFKTITALAALESGIIPKDFTTSCHGYIDYHGHRFHCWQKDGHHSVNFIHAMRQSCDVFFYEIAQRIGIDRIAEMASRFGAGHPTGLELPGEKDGLLPSKEWKKRVKKDVWRVSDTIMTSIGQGFLLFTPLQLVRLMATLCHPEQKILRPTLIYGQTPQLLGSLNIQDEHRQIVLQGLDDTINSPQGIAHHARIGVAGREMGGKTSTAQVRRISMEERKTGVLKNEQRPWEHRDHAMFAGYAPVQNPRYAVSVVIEHGGGGGRVAAPIGRDILYKTQQIMGG
jgi:penicillin-binding protein 2